MKSLEARNFEVLNGEKAIEALSDYIEELEERRGKDLTEKQTDAMIKLAKGLISSIKSEIHNSNQTERLCAELALSIESEISLTRRLKKAITSALDEAKISMHETTFPEKDHEFSHI